MKLLQERIITDGTVRPGNILKVDNFLNHQVDVNLLMEMGKEFKRIFGHLPVTKIVTVEASGIAIATAAALAFDIPFVFAKKAKSLNLDGDLYTSAVHSYTYDRDYTITLAKKFLTKEDKVLIIDDFLAMGNALRGAIDIIEQSGAELMGIGIAIEKGFQPGGKALREAGYNLHSLAIVRSMDDDGNMTFAEE